MFLELTAGAALAVAFPVLDRTAATPEFFPSRHVSSLTIVIFALLVIAVVPAALMVIELLLAMTRPKLQLRLHAFFLGALMTLVALNIGNICDARLAAKVRIDSPGWLVLATAILLGAGSSRLVARWIPARSTLRVLGLSPIVILSMFLLRAPITPPEAVRALKLTDPAPVVLLIFDEFPSASLLAVDGSLDAARVPNFARLAGEATWWSDATTVADDTPDAVPAILSGRRVETGSAPSLANYPRNIFTLLNGTYRVNALEPVTDLCPVGVCSTSKGVLSGLKALGGDGLRIAADTVLPPEYQSAVPPVVGKEGAINSPDLATAVFLRGLRRGVRPSLSVVHLILPHHPWNHHASGEIYSEPYDNPSGLPDGFLGPNWTRSGSRVRRSWTRHLDQVGFADRVLGRVMNRLQSMGLYDGSLLAVIADHGISFQPGKLMRGITKDNVAEIAAVPMFIKRPHQSRGERVSGRADTTALLPTLLDILGAPPADTEGSLLRGASPGNIRLFSLTGDVVTSTVTELQRQRRALLERQVAAVRDLPLGAVQP